MRRALLLGCLALAAGLRAGAEVQALGGFQAPLSPLGENSFATAHRLGYGGWVRGLWRSGDWGLGVEGLGADFLRQDQTGRVDWWQAGLAAEWGFSLDEVGGDRLTLSLAGGWGGVNASAPQIGRQWTAPAGSLGLTYHLPLGARLDLLAGGALWGVLGPGGYDPLASAGLGLGLAFKAGGEGNLP